MTKGLILELSSSVGIVSHIYSILDPKLFHNLLHFPKYHKISKVHSHVEMSLKWHYICITSCCTAKEFKPLGTNQQLKIESSRNLTAAEGHLESASPNKCKSDSRGTDPLWHYPFISLQEIGQRR